MKIIETPETTLEIYNHIREKVDKPRREGIHLSSLLYCNYKSFYRATLEKLPSISNDTAVLFWSGYAFQYFLKPWHKEEPYIVDGIYCSPDIEDTYFSSLYVFFHIGDRGSAIRLIYVTRNRTA